MTKLIALLVPKSFSYLDIEYSKKEIREGIKQFYLLPPNSSIVLDLRSIYGMLGIEYQMIFDLYALGFTLASIAWYWNRIKPRDKSKNSKSYGNRIVKRLVDKIQWLFQMHIVSELGPNLSKREQERNVYIH